MVCQGPGQCVNADALLMILRDGKKSRRKGRNIFAPSSVGRASTNVDFLPDLALLRNGAIFLHGAFFLRCAWIIPGRAGRERVD
jgi:hypothetical protein